LYPLPIQHNQSATDSSLERSAG